MKRANGLVSLVLVMTGLTAGGLAHERLRVNGTGSALFWSDPSNIGIVINSDGSDDVVDGSHTTALRMALDEWNAVDGTNVSLVENADPTQQARTDWAADDIHMIWFDETNSSGYFGGGGIVAITPVWFFSNGRITDADVLFNGSDFSFTTSGEFNHFDVGDVGTHELGHLIGLDHSGWAGASMYPYVGTTIILHRSVSTDEVRGLRDISPLGSFGRITGAVQRQIDSTPVAGAHMVALDIEGRTAASALTSASGQFTIVGLEAGIYSVYANPLDAPVSTANLTPGHQIETDFETTYFASSAVVSAGGTAALGSLSVSPDVAVKLGSSFDPYPLRVVKGFTVSQLVRGSMLTAGCSLTASDPDISLSGVQWLSSGVAFQINVPASEANGHFDLQVTTPGGDVSVLTGGMEVTPLTPSLTSVSVSVAASTGGTPISIFGAHFQPGSRVVIGDQIYRDGVPGGCTVVDSGTITLTTLPTIGGTHDVVVVDSTGLEGRLVAGFQAVSIPALTTIFPTTGSAAGGTEVILTGADFVPGVSVRIDGVTQSSVTVEDDTILRVLTEGGTPGGPFLLEVENPGGAIATGVFAYVPLADPTIAGAQPPSGAAGGGTTVTLSGEGFSSDSTVRFGIDPNTGAGGEAAESVVFIDSTTLEVTTPAHAAGLVSVLVANASSGQATVLEGGFSFIKASTPGGGCYVRPFQEPSGDPGAFLLGGWWILALLAATLWLRGRGEHAVGLSS